MIAPRAVTSNGLTLLDDGLYYRPPLVVHPIVFGKNLGQRADDGACPTV